ncbi:unnamed protein product [Mortierella alpina]
MHLYPLLAIVTLLCTTVFGFPAQLTLHSPHKVEALASEVTRSDDASTLLLEFAARLDRGMPDGWQKLTNVPETTGSTDVQTVSTLNLKETVEGWGLPLSTRDQAHQDVLNLVELHASEAIFVSQTFTYNAAPCEGDGLPVCLQSLMVIVRRQPGLEGQDLLNLYHIWIESKAKAIQQYRGVHTCHSCRIVSRCCHDSLVPRDFEVNEMMEIQAVLSTSQAAWCHENLPAEPTISPFNALNPTCRSTWPLSPPQDVSLPGLLQRFIDNDDENEDVFRLYDDALLSTLQGSMHSTQKRTKSFSLSLKRQDLSIVSNLLRPCFQEAGITTSIEELWQKAQEGPFTRPFSLECQNLQQKRIIDGEPRDSCNKSATLYVNMLHSWVVLYPRQESIDCVFMETSVEAQHLECEMQPTKPKDPECHRPALAPSQPSQTDRPGVEDPDVPSKGSIVRWSVPQHEGRFSPVEYLARWSAYSHGVNKAAMDIVRFLSATSFLKAPVPHLEVMYSLADGSVSLEHQMIDPATLLTLGKALGTIADGWDKVSKVLFGSSSQKITRKICLGFERYAQTVRVIKAEGIPEEKFLDQMEVLLRVGQVQVKEVGDLRELISLIDVTDDLTWRGLTTQYTSSSDSSHSWACFYKHRDLVTNKSTVVFGTLKADFIIAQDVLIVETKKVGPLGTGRDESVEFRGMPHDITPNDAALLNKYFEVVAYRELAPLLGSERPEYPTIPPCPQ